MNNSVAFRAFTVLCNFSFHLIPKYFHFPERNPLPLSSFWPPSPLPTTPPQPLAATNLLSVSMDLSSLDILCKQNHSIICDLWVWPLAPCIMCSGLVHRKPVLVPHSFLWVNNVLLTFLIIKIVSHDSSSLSDFFSPTFESLWLWSG